LSTEGDTVTVVYTYNAYGGAPSYQTFNQFTFTGQAGQVQPGQQFQIYSNAATPVAQPAQGPVGTVTMQGIGSLVTSATSTNPVPTLVSSQSYQVINVSNVGNTYTVTYSPATPFPIPIGFILVQQVPKNHSTVFLDTDVIPGTYHYYGIYVLTLSGPNNDLYEWQRAGVTACLATRNWDSSNWLWYHIPPHFRLVDPDRNLTQDFQGIDYLYQFMQVFAWGLDYLRTQYAMLQNMNNPLIIPINDLYNLAAELGFDFEPEVSMTTVRNGILNSTTVMRERGTLQGIRHHINILTGWDVDLQVGVNQMLEQDQSFFPDPVPPVYNPALSYYVGEQVCYPGYGIGAANYVFQCIQASPGQPTPHPQTPPFTSPFWQVVQNNPITSTLFNPQTTNQNTWEARSLVNTGQWPDLGAIQEVQGVLNPLDSNLQDHTANRLRTNNWTDGIDNLELQSISRIGGGTFLQPAPDPGNEKQLKGISFLGAVPELFELSNTALYPDNTEAIADGIPVPFAFPQDTWNPDFYYGTGEIVQYNGLPYISLRASIGVQPGTYYQAITGNWLTSAAYTSSTEWALLGFDHRIALMLSAYCLGSTSVTVTPFMVWFDIHGNFIQKIYSRATVSNNLFFDSFSASYGVLGSAHNPELPGDGTHWIADSGTFTAGPYNGRGAAWPTPPINTAQAYRVLISSGMANCQVGVTFVTPPSSAVITGSIAQGIIFRWQSDTQYWRCGRYYVMLVNTTKTIMATHSTPFSDGDRMVVSMNGSTINVYRNNNPVPVSTVTSATFSTNTVHGLTYESQ
jgi:hypothetical protein